MSRLYTYLTTSWTFPKDAVIDTLLIIKEACTAENILIRSTFVQAPGETDFNCWVLESLEVIANKMKRVVIFASLFVILAILKSVSPAVTQNEWLAGLQDDIAAKTKLR